LSDTREIGARIIPVLGRRRPHQRNAGRRSNGLKLTLFRGPRYVRPSGSRPTFESRRGFPADGTQSPPSEGARTGSQRPTHWGALMPIQSAGRQRGAKFMCFVCFASLSGSFRRGQAGFAVGPQSHPPRGSCHRPQSAGLSSDFHTGGGRSRRLLPSLRASLLPSQTCRRPNSGKY
jgi:hypothetical protein